ncbi:MAG TPA: hypothetical protein VJQ45_02035 [Ktedonobacterales bacterium]|nr:hypothetical protein [Ktedonobacterales bacterium]
MVAVVQAVEPTTEDQLVEVLSFLNPPQQDYVKLAAHAAALLEKLPPQPSVLRALAAYCDLFGRGYNLWQITYDYPRIHEYLFGAYLQALTDGRGALLAPAAEVLRQLSEAVIAYTWCENSLITNDPEGLFQHSRDGIGHVDAGSAALPSAGWSERLADPIREYLEFNRALFSGLNCCAKGYLAARDYTDLSPDDYQTLDESLATLKETSYELYSELRAHYTFMKLLIERGLEAARTGSPGLLVKQGDMLLRGIGYIGENLVAGLFEDYKKAPGELLKAAGEQTKLPIESIHSTYMPDIFETTLGRDYREQMTVDLCKEDTELNFVVPDGRDRVAYTAETFQVTISRFGSIVFEVGCSVEGNLVEDDPDEEDPETKGTSVSHVRILESMVGPHAGRFPIDWVGAPVTLEDDIKVLAARRMLTFVDTYLRARDWLAHLSVVAPGPEIEQMAAALAEWYAALGRLVPHLPPPGAAGSEGELTITEGLEKSYRELRGCRDKLRRLARDWMKQHTEPELADEVATGEDIFPKGLRFGRLMDVGIIVVDRVRKFLEDRYGATVQAKERHTGGDYHDIRYTSAFDANTGWQTVFCCNQLLLKMPDGELQEPQTPDDFKQVRKTADFKGFQVQSREARAGIDDWPFASGGKVRNLAKIRSHLTDVMYVGENRAFLWFPDDPQFITTQYVESARLIGDIRVLLLTYNESAKHQIRATEGMLDVIKSGLRLPRKLAGQFEAGRNDITIFRTHGDKILDLLRACTISKFEDHGQLLSQMLIESKAGNAREALEHNLTTLDEFYAYITQVLQRRVEARTHSGQTLMASVLGILTAVSALSAIPPLENFLVATFGKLIGQSVLLQVLQYLLVILLVGSVGIALYALWQRVRSV